MLLRLYWMFNQFKEIFNRPVFDEVKLIESFLGSALFDVCIGRCI
jgi:hypothetical protein